MIRTYLRASAVLTFAGCLVSLAACSWPLGTNGPSDVRVTFVSDVDFKSEMQLQWISTKPRPSILISRIDFTTATDLLALARKYDYNVWFAIGPCSKNGVKQSVGPYGGVFWRKSRIYSETKDVEIPGYSEMVSKGPPFTYQVYVERLPANPPTPMCFTLSGGNMLGGKLRSNDAVIPAQH